MVDSWVQERYSRVMWIIGAVVILVFAGCVFAMFFVGKTGPFAAVSQIGREGKVYGVNGATDFHDDLRKPRNEQELL